MSVGFVSMRLAVAIVLVVLAGPLFDSPAGGASAEPAADRPKGQSREGGSVVPCATPLRWRVARVDRAFGLTEEDATRHVREAATWWADAVGVELFVHDARDGWPVRLVYDERQAVLQERNRRELELDEEAGDLGRRRAELVARNDDWSAAQEEYRDRVEVYEDELAEHNAMVREWNRRGGAPEDVGRELADRGRELEARRRVLDRELRELREERDRLESEERDFNAFATAHTRRGDELVRDFPPTPVQSGEYREAVRRENGRVTSVSREIRVYRFGDDADLRLVVAHEFGHALGLGHSPVTAAVMSEQHVRDGDVVGVREVHDDDVARLRALCSDLGGGSGRAPRRGRAAHPHVTGVRPPSPPSSSSEVSDEPPNPRPVPRPRAGGLRHGV